MGLFRFVALLLDWLAITALGVFAIVLLWRHEAQLGLLALIAHSLYCIEVRLGMIVKKGEAPKEERGE